MTESGGQAPRGPLSPDIEIAQLRQILLWPLVLCAPAMASHEGSTRPAGSMNLAAELRRIKGNLTATSWVEVEDLLNHAVQALPQTDSGEARATAPKSVDPGSYAEFVYFYDFLQSLLYRSDSQPKDFTLWRRDDVGAVTFDLLAPSVRREGDRRITFSATVERFNLYLFETGAAVLTVELEFGRAPMVRDNGRERRMSLADALTVCDHVRRVYTPYFKDRDATLAPARVPLRFLWRRKREIAFDDPEVEDDDPLFRVFRPASSMDDLAFISATDGGRRSAPIFGHWRAALSPLRLPGDAPGAAEPVWRHVVDERIPLMTFLSLSGAARALDIPSAMFDEAAAQRDDLALVSRGDWVRLCNADEAGGDELPYAPEFLADFERECCYDRFFPSAQTTTAVRFLFAGYHVALAGAGGFFDGVMVQHFRRHYFQMALLVNMELASLLAVSSRISDAVALLDERPKRPGRHDRVAAERAFRDALRCIQRDFLNFVHRYRFTRVSNQVQPSELYARWRRSLRLDELFDDVKGELDAAFQFNTGEDSVSLAQAGTRLAGVAALLGSLSVGLTVLQVGDNIKVFSLELDAALCLIAHRLCAVPPPAGPGFSTALLTMVLTLLVATLLGYHAVRTLFRQDDDESRSVRRVFRRALALLAASAGLLLVLELALAR